MFGRKRKDRKPKAPKPQNAREWGVYLLREWVKPFLIVLAIFLPFRSVVADWNDVPSGSMQPTIMVGDRIFVNKLAYGLRVPFTEKWITRWGEPERGEIVVCASPETGVRLVKRVIAVPGDTVAMRGGMLRINRQPVRYAPLDPDDYDDALPPNGLLQSETVGADPHTILRLPIPRTRSFGPVRLGDNQYWVMGDNRDNSEDSRKFGVVTRDAIVGRSGRVVVSFDYNNYYLPRADRFFRRLE